MLGSIDLFSIENIASYPESIMTAHLFIELSIIAKCLLRF